MHEKENVRLVVRTRQIRRDSARTGGDSSLVRFVVTKPVSRRQYWSNRRATTVSPTGTRRFLVRIRALEVRCPVRPGARP